MSRRYRLPVLTDEILEEIIWGMENQDFNYSLNTMDGTLYSSEVNEEPVPAEYLIELPPWYSSDGYQIMVSFTNACKDTDLQRRLVNELNYRKPGVFRRFRNVLGTSPEALDQFYKFKDSKMKSFIRSWFRRNYGRMTDAERETGDEDLLSGDLLADFEITHLDKADQYCDSIVEELCKGRPTLSMMMGAFTDREAFIIDKDGRECGALVYERLGDEVCILAYNVEPEFRRIGLFSLMFDMFNREMERNQVRTVTMPFVQDSAFFKQTFHEYDVTLCQLGEFASYSVKEWNEGSESSEYAYLL